MTYQKLEAKLKLLTIDEIRELRDLHKESHTFWALCNIVIQDKLKNEEKDRMNYFIDEYMNFKKLKNALHSATNNEQGK